MEWMIRTADMMNDSFREDYRPGAGSATIPDSYTEYLDSSTYSGIQKIVKPYYYRGVARVVRGWLQVGFWNTGSFS